MYIVHASAVQSRERARVGQRVSMFVSSVRSSAFARSTGVYRMLTATDLRSKRHASRTRLVAAASSSSRLSPNQRLQPSPQPPGPSAGRLSGRLNLALGVFRKAFWVTAFEGATSEISLSSGQHSRPVDPVGRAFVLRVPLLEPHEMSVFAARLAPPTRSHFGSCVNRHWRVSVSSSLTKPTSSTVRLTSASSRAIRLATLGVWPAEARR